MQRSEHEQICKPLAESKAETSDTQRKKTAPVKTVLVDSATKERRESTVQSPILSEIATSHQRLKPAEDSAQEFLCSLSCNCIFLSHLSTFSQHCSFKFQVCTCYSPLYILLILFINFPIWAKHFPLFHSTFFLPCHPPHPRVICFHSPPLMWDTFLFDLNMFITIG